MSRSGLVDRLTREITTGLKADYGEATRGRDEMMYGLEEVADLLEKANGRLRPLIRAASPGPGGVKSRLLHLSASIRATRMEVVKTLRMVG